MRHWMLSTTPDGDESGPYGMESFDGDIIPVPTEQDPDPYPICSMYYTSDETNAKLIASAPEMHDTLTAIAAALGCAPGDVLARLAQWKTALQFYADGNNYQDGIPGIGVAWFDGEVTEYDWEYDMGDKAKEADAPAREEGAHDD